MPSRSRVVSRETPEWLYDAEEASVSEVYADNQTCAHSDDDHESSKEAKDVLQYWMSKYKKRYYNFVNIQMFKYAPPWKEVDGCDVQNLPPKKVFIEIFTKRYYFGEQIICAMINVSRGLLETHQPRM